MKHKRNTCTIHDENDINTMDHGVCLRRHSTFSELSVCCSCRCCRLQSSPFEQACCLSWVYWVSTSTVSSLYEEEGSHHWSCICGIRPSLGCSFTHSLTQSHSLSHSFTPSLSPFSIFLYLLYSCANIYIYISFISCPFNPKKLFTVPWMVAPVRGPMSVPNTSVPA